MENVLVKKKKKTGTETVDGRKRKESLNFQGSIKKLNIHSPSV
jgi:hypothetical protein